MSAKAGRQSAAQARARLKAAREMVDADDETLGDHELEHQAAAPQPASAAPAPEASPATLPQALQALPSPNGATDGGGEHQQGTGIDVAAEIVERVQREARRRSRSGGREITQTEIVLNAFEVVYERLPELIARHQAQQRITSPLFGTRTVHGSSKIGPTKRLQIRPTYNEKNSLHALAEHFKMPLTELTRIVLKEYFYPEKRKDENASKS